MRVDRKRADGRGLCLADFAAHNEATSSGLSVAEVLALRLYTTAAFRTVNTRLRDAVASSGGLSTERKTPRPHPLPCTVAFLKDGLMKLRNTHVDRGQATEAIDLWRGLKDMTLSDAFVSAGGTEVAPMSTTKDWKVALGYSRSRAPLVFKIRSNCFANRGADISFLSAFPAEQEFLYPPLTFLRPTGWCKEVSLGDEHGTIKVVEMEPNLS